MYEFSMEQQKHWRKSNGVHHIFHGQLTIFTWVGISQFVIKSSCPSLSMLTYGGMYQCIQSNCAWSKHEIILKLLMQIPSLNMMISSGLRSICTLCRHSHLHSHSPKCTKCFLSVRMVSCAPARILQRLGWWRISPCYSMEKRQF